MAQQLREVRSLVEDMRDRPETGETQRTDALSTLCRVYHSYKFLDSAEVCYRNVLRRQPRDFASLHLLGRVHEQAGRLERARQFYQKARGVRPDYPATAVRLGGIALQLNEPEAARREFEAALEADPDNPAAIAGLGEAALAAKDYTAAIRLLEKALKLAPAANRLHYSLAMAYRGAGDLQKAKAHLEQRGTAGIRPADPIAGELRELQRGERVHLLRGRLAFGAERYAEAAAAFSKAVEADPQSVRARVNLGAALGKLGKQDEAVAQFRMALDASPGHLTASYNLGALLLDRGQVSEASRHFRHVVEQQPDDPGVNRSLARALLLDNREDEAIPYLAKVVELSPRDENALLQLVELLLGRGKYARAKDLLEKTHERFPAWGRTAHALARILAACPDPALRDGERALALAVKIHDATQLPFHAETVALALAQLGRCEEAAGLQAEVIASAESVGSPPQRIERLSQQLERYKNERPCAAPAGDPR